MAYAGSFHRIVAIGSLYGNETFNFTLSMVPTENPLDVEEVTDELATTIASRIQTWWSTASGPSAPQIVDDAVLREVKVNRIASTGRYQDNDVHTVLLGTPTAGTVSANLPSQLTTAVTLRTARARGRGSRGRFYLPPVSGLGTLDTSGRLTVARAQEIAISAKALVESINLAYWARDGGLRTMMMVGVASDIGTGIFEPATSLEVGRVVDTMRSRRSSLFEDHQEVTIAPPA